MSADNRDGTQGWNPAMVTVVKGLYKTVDYATETSLYAKYSLEHSMALVSLTFDEGNCLEEGVGTATNSKNSNSLAFLPKMFRLIKLH